MLGISLLNDTVCNFDNLYSPQMVAEQQRNITTKS